jgi:multicomponent K+:H+ antiporter subunit F
MIVSTLLPFAIGALTLALLLNAYRLLRGPGLADRILALDTMYINAMALLILVGIRFGTAVFFEAALVIALMGFVGTVVLSKFVIRGNVAE